MANFIPAKYLFERSYGAWNYATIAMLKTFRAVETSSTRIYIAKSLRLRYESVLDNIKKLSLISPLRYLSLP